ALKGVFDHKQSEKIAIHFNYQWTMKDETVVSFDVADILELEGAKIKKLTIIYDTYHSRSAFENLVD
ncbi:MAG: hypothetical protein ACR2MX_06720, partial [Cyclobacteriaceae bacterium]